jgi:hypothetical protein
MATLINVGGTSRSGSTMVHLILGNTADAFSCGEVMNWFRPVKTHHFKINCVCGKYPCPIWEKFETISEEQFYAIAFRELKVNFLIDSSKELSWLIDAWSWATTNEIKAFNIFVWKDPINLAYSFWKRGNDLMFWRSQFVKYYKRVIEVGLPVLAVNYNDLTRNPRVKVAEICAALGMPYFEGKERFWEKEHHHLFGSLGVRRQVEAGNSIIKSKDKYPPDFEIYVDFLQKRIAADSRVQHIVEFLRQADVSLISSEGSYTQQFLPHKPYPPWYYIQRAKQLFRKHFPKKTDPTKHEQVATIPLKQR